MKSTFIRTIFIIPALLLLTHGCATYDSDGTPAGVGNLPTISLSLNETASKVNETMKNTEIAYQNDSVTIYNLNDHRKVIACEFEDDKLDALIIYVYKDMVSWDAVKASFSGFDVKSEVRNQGGSYVSKEKKTYGEITSITKDGIEYYCIGYSAIH